MGRKKKPKKRHSETAIYLTAIGIVVGVFLPLATVPLYGDVSYFRAVPVESCILIACALSGPFFLIKRKPKLLIGSAVSIWLTVYFPELKSKFSNRTGLERALDTVSTELSDLASDAFWQVADLQWGGYLLLGSLIAFSVSCLTRAAR